jgi:hypothetical protein
MRPELHLEFGYLNLEIVNEIRKAQLEDERLKEI